MKLRSVTPMKIAKYGYIAISAIFTLAGLAMIFYPTPSQSFIGIFFGIAILVFGIIKLVGYWSRDLFRLAFQYDLQFGVLLCVLGVVLFVWPGVSVAVIGELLGIGMIVFGAVKVAGYLSRDLFRLAFQYDLAFGVLLIALGIVTLTHPGETIGFLCVVYGILVLSDGLFKVQIAVDAKRFGIDRWWAILLAAACAGVLGVLLVLRPGEGAQALTMLLGASLFLDGVMNLLVALLTVKIIRHQQPDVIETDEFEIK